MTGGPQGADVRGAGYAASLATVARQWSRLGVIGFGGPPAHIALLHALCVRDRGWITETEFQDGMAATNLLPGPASTQLAIFCAWRVRGVLGAVVGGLCFIAPGFAMILGLSVLFLAARPPQWIVGAAAGAGAAVPAVALQAARGLVPASWRRAGPEPVARLRWVVYLLAGGAAAALVGPYLVVVLLVCGCTEIAARRPGRPVAERPASALLPLAAGTPVAVGGLLAVAWVAFTVGALSYGGGFVIVPLMQHAAVSTYHWMTGARFLDAVALGQVTPGPVVLTVAVVGYAARGVGGALLATAVAFSPSFAFVVFGAPHFDRLRRNGGVQAFLTGAGATAIGAIAGSSIPLALALSHLWQLGVLAVAAVALLGFHRNVVLALLGAGLVGVVAVAAGAPA